MAADDATSDLANSPTPESDPAPGWEPPSPAEWILALQRLQSAWVDRPFTVVLATVLVIPGAFAVIYGDDVSRALAAIAADTVSRGMGAALLAGGVTTVVGIARGRTLIEVIGLSLLAVGCGIYGLGVLLGLGFAGVVAGSGFLAIALAIVRRVVTLAAVAPKVGAGVQ